jgi:transcriptional regulator with XRE-family HTH domain
VAIESKCRTELGLLGEHLLSLREQQKLGKEKFGKLCGLSEAQIRKIEKGEANIKLETLVKLKTGLDMSIAVLLGRGTIRSFSKKTKDIGLKENFQQAKINLGKRLSMLVKHRGFKTLPFSIKVGMDESAANKYLNGEENPTYLTLFKFADALDVKVVDFFDYDGPLPGNSTVKGKSTS